MQRIASCVCGGLTVQATGKPVAVSVCHCLECQKRTGSAFGAQARFHNKDLVHEGRVQEYTRTGNTGASVSFYFCPTCGTTVYWKAEKLPDKTSVALGAFADPNFVEKLSYTVFNQRRHSWVGELLADEDYD